MLPRLKWLIFQMPISSPQRIRMLGFFSAIARLLFRKCVVGTRAGAMAETDGGGNLHSRVGCRNWTKVQSAAGTWRGQPLLGCIPQSRGLRGSRKLQRERGPDQVRCARRGRGHMSMQRNFTLFVALAMAAAMPAGAAGSDASIPELAGVWTHFAFPWFEPPASGPGPITNLSRWPEQRPAGATGSAAMPPSKVGISDYDQLVGDYKSPLLQPWAAEVVKKFGELSLRGITYPNPSNQCWPEPMPFIYKQF